MRSVCARNAGQVACVLKYQRVRWRASSAAAALTDEIDRFAHYQPTTLSLQKFIDFGMFLHMVVSAIIDWGSTVLKLFTSLPNFAYFALQNIINCVTTKIFGNKLCHPRSVAYSAGRVLLNKHQISGGGACLLLG